MTRTRSFSSLVDRRRFLSRTADGLGCIALAALSEAPRRARAADLEIDPSRPYAPRSPRFKPRATNVIVVQCSGALSHVDTFDFKPELVRHHGKPMPGTRDSSRSRARTAISIGRSGRSGDADAAASACRTSCRTSAIESTSCASSTR